MRNRVTSAILVALLMLLPAAGVTGADTAADSVYPRIDRTMFIELIRPLGIDDEQRMIAEMLFADYASAIGELMVLVDTRADEAGRRRVDEALSGRRRLSPDELRELRVAVLEVMRDAWPEADALREELLATVTGVLTEEQAIGAEAALPGMRRALWLAPWRGGRADREYAGDGLDLFLQVEEACAGELAGLEDLEALETILARYEAHLDTLLLEMGPAARNAVFARRIARINRDDALHRAEERALVDRWRQLYTLNQQTSAAIGELAERHLGPGARARWQRRIRVETFPWLLADTTPRRRIEWIRRSDLDAATRAAAETAWSEYETRHDALADDAISLMLRGRLELGRVLHPATDPASVESAAERHIYQELLKNSGARAHLERTTVEKLESGLPVDVRSRMRRETR